MFSNWGQWNVRLCRGLTSYCLWTVSCSPWVSEESSLLLPLAVAGDKPVLFHSILLSCYNPIACEQRLLNNTFVSHMHVASRFRRFVQKYLSFCPCHLSDLKKRSLRLHPDPGAALPSRGACPSSRPPGKVHGVTSSSSRLALAPSAGLEGLSARLWSALVSLPAPS